MEKFIVISSTFIILAAWIYISNSKDILSSSSSYIPFIHLSPLASKNSIKLNESLQISSLDEMKPQKDFSYQPPILHINATNSLSALGLTCSPQTFGYNDSFAEKIFPIYEYPHCGKKTLMKKSMVYINRINQTVEFQCDSKYNYYFSGPVKGFSLMRRQEVGFIKLKELSKQKIKAKDVEFVYSFCADNEEDKSNFDDNFIGAHMSPRFYPDLIEKSKPKEGKPKIIIMVTIDSVSRKHFYRKLRSVTHFLNITKKYIPDIALYDFKLHSTYAPDSVYNQVPIFGGKNFKKKLKKGILGDRLGNNSIWYDMKQKGFITMLGFDDCDLWFPNILGINPNVDFSVRQFYCIADEYLNIKTEKKDTKQRCIGPYQSHFYMLNYTLDLIQMYKGANLWIYLHLNAGHEQTGQHTSTLDSDLIQFLINFFQYTKDSEIFMFLGADHGMRYGKWFHTIEAFQETKMPSMFILASKSWLDQIPYSYHSLHENSLRLTSKLDIRKTMLYLIGINEDESKSINLLNEIGKISRNCIDINAKPEYCACSALKKDFDPEYFVLIENVKDQVQRFINQVSYANPKYMLGEFCDKVELNLTKENFLLEVSEELGIFIVNFGSGFNRTEKFKVIFLFGTDFQTVFIEETELFWFYSAVKGENVMVKVKSIDRLDKYGGPHEKLLEQKGIPAAFCVPSNKAVIV